MIFPWPARERATAIVWAVISRKSRAPKLHKLRAGWGERTTSHPRSIDLALPRRSVGFDLYRGLRVSADLLITRAPPARESVTFWLTCARTSVCYPFVVKLTSDTRVTVIFRLINSLALSRSLGSSVETSWSSSTLSYSCFSVTI